MRTLSNEPLYEYTRRQLAAKPELTPKVQTRMRNVLLLFYRQLNNETAQTQGQDVRQLSDFILVSRSSKSSLFFPSLTMVRRDSALSLGLKQLCQTEWWSPLFWRPVPAPALIQVNSLVLILTNCTRWNMSVQVSNSANSLSK